MVNDLQHKGIEYVMQLHDCSATVLDYLGRVASLSEHPDVVKIEPNEIGSLELTDLIAWVRDSAEVEFSALLVSVGLYTDVYATEQDDPAFEPRFINGDDFDLAEGNAVYELPSFDGVDKVRYQISFCRERIPLN